MLAQKSQFCQEFPQSGFEIFKKIGDDTMGFNWLILILHIIILLLLLIAIDTGLLKFSCRPSLPLNFDENLLDSDVRAERNRVLSSNPSLTSYQNPVNIECRNQESLTDHLTVHDLVKRYGGSDKFAVNHLTFGAKRGEAFGLLGYNVSDHFSKQNKKKINI
jgi:hypothetical protein